MSEECRHGNVPDECLACELEACPTCATLRRELEEAKDKGLAASILNTELCLKLQSADACCNAFLDANRGEDIASLFVLLSTQDHDHIKRLALKATGREK